MDIPKEAKELLERGEVHLATTDGVYPNRTITQSGVVIGSKDNILKNPNCSLSVYDSKKMLGYKAFGRASYHARGIFLGIAQKKLKGEPFRPKGTVVIKIEKIFKIEQVA